MAGSISISMSTQFDSRGNLLSGGKIYFIEAGTTSTPQNAYYDVDLTSPLPNPLTLDAGARVPAFYLADGQIKIRITDEDGVTQLEQDNILVIGPSSGGGGGGGQVDQSTIFQTGDTMWQPVSGSRTGWVRDNGRSIGSATSGATERANADCEALFSYLWNKYSDTFCPVSTGRGVSASADWSSNKTITLLDFRNCAPGGLDDMGASAAGRFADVPVVLGDVTTAGSIIGEIAHTLASSEIPAHTHPATVTDPGHTHAYERPVQTFSYQSGSGAGVPGPNSTSTGSSTTGVTVAVGSNTGGGGSHNNVQRTVLGTFYRKL